MSKLKTFVRGSRKCRCTCCGSEYDATVDNFHISKSPLYKANDNLLTVCRTCVNDLYKKYLELLQGNEYEALKRIAMFFDLPFSKEIFETAKNTSKVHGGVRVRYWQLIRHGPYEDMTFDDYLFSGRYNEDLKRANSNGNISDKELIINKYSNIWGLGFSATEYVLLQNMYDEWNAKVVIDGMSRESLVRDLCIIKLQQQKALQAEDIDLYTRLQKTYQSTLSSANLNPIQLENEEKKLEKPIGQMIEMMENEEPAPNPLPEWEDVDGIVKLINVYFKGHLCKMLGIKNRYSEMYENEMQKYRVNIEEPEEMSDEDIFEYLNENGFSESKVGPSENKTENESDSSG